MDTTSVSADCDTVLFPAHPDGIRFLDDNVAWQSVRLSERTRRLLENGTIRNGAFYETAPGPQAVTRIATGIRRVLPSDDEPGKWRIEFEEVEPINPIAGGGLSLRNFRFVSMARLREVRSLNDL